MDMPPVSTQVNFSKSYFLHLVPQMIIESKLLNLIIDSSEQSIISMNSQKLEARKQKMVCGGKERGLENIFL